MRAALADRYGPPEVVHVGRTDVPVPGPGEVLVRVHATTVNRTDCAYRASRPFFMRALTGLRRPRQPVWGTEFAGVVDGAGPGADRFAVGDRVFGYTEGTFGAHAEYLTIKEGGSVARVPDGVDLRTAAAGTEGAHYALAFLRRAGVRAGQSVLVHGATGAIGSAAVQLLKSKDVTVTAVCATEHLDLVRGLGADRVIDYTAVDFTRDPHRYHAVFDTVGKSTFRRCRRLLRSGGVYVSSELGPFAQNAVLPLVTRLARRRVVFPFPAQGREVVEHLAASLGSGHFRPVVDRSYRLEEVVEAYRYVETGQKVGNVVVEVAL